MIPTRFISCFHASRDGTTSPSLLPALLARTSEDLQEEGPRAKHGLECSGCLSFTGLFSFQRVNCWSINLCATRGLLGHPDPSCLHGPCQLASTGLGILSLLSSLHREGWKVRSNFSRLPLIGGLSNNGRIISMDVGLSSFLCGAAAALWTNPSASLHLPVCRASPHSVLASFYFLRVIF